jgi:hypothetical protein
MLGGAAEMPTEEQRPILEEPRPKVLDRPGFFPPTSRTRGLLLGLAAVAALILVLVVAL